MGSNHSRPIVAKDSNCSECCDQFPLSCFKNDHRVKHRQCTRLLPQKWIRTNKHQAMLQHLLFSQYEIPSTIAVIIEEFAYAAHENLIAEQLDICKESYYSSNQALLAKPLCGHWYATFFAATPNFSVVMACKDKSLMCQCMSGLKSASLPTMRRTPDDALYVPWLRRFTSFVDSHFFSVQVSTMNAVKPLEHEKEYRQPHVCMVVIDAEESAMSAYHQIEAVRKRWSHNAANGAKPVCVLLVRITRHQTKPGDRREEQGIKLLCDQYNLCLLDVDLTDSQNGSGGAQKIFSFAIKYYWFKHST